MKTEDKIKDLIIDALAKSQGMKKDEIKEVGLELSRNKNNEHGDFSSNIALKLSGNLKRSPVVIAEEIINSVQASDEIERLEFAKPGFINFYLSSDKKNRVLEEIMSKGRDFGSSCVSEKKKVLLEFVSANPTGPLHVGHGRHAAFGDSLARLLRKSGHEVFTEYYLNDAGRQIDILCVSVMFELLLLEGQKLGQLGGLYKGSYIKKIAGALRDEGIVINKKVSIPKASGSDDKIIDALIFCTNSYGASIPIFSGELILNVLSFSSVLIPKTFKTSCI